MMVNMVIIGRTSQTKWSVDSNQHPNRNNDNRFVTKNTTQLMKYNVANIFGVPVVTTSGRLRLFVVAVDSRSERKM
jgi:hypothetical protein